MQAKYKKERSVIEDIAKQQGIPVSEVLKEINQCIESAFNEDDPDRSEELQALFGDVKPTPEEFINRVTKMLK